MSARIDTSGPVSVAESAYSRAAEVRHQRAYADKALAKADLVADYRFNNKSKRAARTYTFFAKEYGLTLAQVCYMAKKLGIRRNEP